MTKRTGARQQLEKLWEQGCTFLGSKYAILAGAMTWVSERSLVSALSNAGGFGVLAGGAMPPEALDEEIKATQAKTTAPFGVNLITMHPKIDQLLEVCVERKVGHVVLAGGLPKEDSIKFLKAEGVKVLCFAPTCIVARKLIRLGADALVIEGMEAGGHIGPVSTGVLVQEILPYIKEVPVFVAGGIGRGEAMVSYLKMGASGCQLGTRFVCATESIAHPKFKQAFIRASARDAMPTAQVDPRFPVIPVRAIVNGASRHFVDYQRSIIEEFQAGTLSMKEAQLKIEHYWAGALRRAVVEGDTESGSLMAGQSVGMVKCEQPVASILEELIDQALEVLERNSCLY